MDEPASRITPEEGTLRSTQNLCAFEVEKLEADSTECAYVDLILIGRGWAFMMVCKIVLPHAANGQQHHGRVPGKRSRLQSGGLAGEILAGTHPELLQLGIRKGRDGDTHVEH